MTWRLLTAEEAAELLGVTAWWLLEEARAERIPHVRLGPRTIRFEGEELKAWADSRKRGPSRLHEAA